MTNLCNCKAEHWQPHADSCPAYKPRPLLTLENIRSGAVPSDAVAVGFLLGEIEKLRNIVNGCPVCAELAANIKPHHEPKVDASFLQLWQALSNDVNAVPCQWPDLRDSLHDWLRSRDDKKSQGASRDASSEDICLIVGCGEPALRSSDGAVGGLCEKHNGNVGLRG